MEGTTYRLADERGSRLIVVHAGRWVVGRKKGMLSVRVVVIVQAQLEILWVRSAWATQEPDKGLTACKFGATAFAPFSYPFPYW